MLTPAYIGAARVLFSGSRRTGRDLENGAEQHRAGNADPKVSALAAIERAPAEAGIEFSNGGKPGVRLRGSSA
ncbi:hypothetical protein MOX02_46500 [Methylobacterium oxalidis]|uniref:Uncharacterized protein n=1 Tax=Methylobacterium oxalidis TaxID=944322 RepID=A0A512J9I7_9HYPH|nr:hypothetical protein MOX02_46500 [Methylobacterium oxalidis]GLS66226.1 hypothetical protein GCM10007888_46080 [Methylobacterium oxalidis]